MRAGLFVAVAFASSTPAFAAHDFKLDYELRVTGTQQRVDGVLGAVANLPADQQRTYNGTLGVSIGAITQTLLPGGLPNQQTRVQSIAVSYDFFQLAPDLLPFAPVSGMPPATTTVQARFEVERAETNGIPDEGGAYRMRELVWNSDLGSATFDLSSFTSHSNVRNERFFAFPGASEAFRFASLDPLDLLRGLETAQYQSCGNFSCIGAGNLAWVLYSGDESLNILSGQTTGTANLFIGTLRLSNARVAVPEPASWALMILGFGIAGAAARSRRRPLTA